MSASITQSSNSPRESPLGIGFFYKRVPRRRAGRPVYRGGCYTPRPVRCTLVLRTRFLPRGMLLVLLIIAATVLLTVAASIIMARASNRSAVSSGILGGLLAPVVLAVILAMAVLVTRLQLPIPRDSDRERPAPRDVAIAVDVLVLNFDPILPQRDGRRLHHALGWRDPRTLARDYAADVERASAGQVQFRIVEWRDLDVFPIKEAGFRYTPEAYQQHFERGDGWHKPDAVDYQRVFDEQRLVPLVDAGTVDEVWLFGGPYFGYSEAAMAGPGAFDVTGCARRRRSEPCIPGDGVQLRAWCGRDAREPVSSRRGDDEPDLRRRQANRLDHDWARFAANQAQSGTAAVGTCHWPPNAEREFDFDNPRVVSSSAPYWRDYPSGANAPERVSRETWGGPDYADVTSTGGLPTCPVRRVSLPTAVSRTGGIRLRVRSLRFHRPGALTHLFQLVPLVKRAGSCGFGGGSGSESPDAGVNLPLQLFVIRQTGELIHEHQRVLRRDLELLPARLARDLVVEPQQIIPKFCKASAIPSSAPGAVGPSWSGAPIER